jgi:hypothetical protein
MNGWIRKLRGAFGTAVTWAIGWAALAVPASGLLWVLGGSDATFLETIGAVTAMAAGSGFLAGGVFSFGLAAVGRNRSLEDLNVLPMALMGGLAAAVLPIAVGIWALFDPVFLLLVDWDVLLPVGATLTAFGAVTAGGLLRIAKGGDADRLPPGE